MNRCIAPLPLSLLLAISGALLTAHAADQLPGPKTGTQILKESFRAEVAELEGRSLRQHTSLEQWQSKRERLRQELFEMLSLSPLPARSDLKPVITGTVEHELFTAEKLHFQSMPGLYVTANLYLPKQIEKPVPAILYVCGHALVKTNGVSFGNKTAYQHHPAWFARNGYACLILDTIQLGEIEGLHHGTYREGMWWWNSRGYTPAGVEAWNCIRALDYLQSRPEVDGSRLGVTGRSGGGAYSWWVTALDDRIKAAAPVAGITDLRSHVVDGVVEGHCDCMYIVNTFRWDYPLVAALAAPRPLLICNSDKDTIFPLDGVVRLHAEVARIYRLYGAANNLGLLITEGPHKDTQDLQLPVFRWFNRHLKKEDPIIEMAAHPFFTPQQLKVFDSIPSDQRTSTIHESFVPAAAPPEPPADANEWASQRDGWRNALREKVFQGWPERPPPLGCTRKQDMAAELGGLLFEVWEFMAADNLPLRLYVLKGSTIESLNRIELRVLDDEDWGGWVSAMRLGFKDALAEEAASAADSAGTGEGRDVAIPIHTVLAYVAPRGVGLTAWEKGPRKQIQMRRRYMLLGQTLDGMQVWDIRRAIQAVRSIRDLEGLPLTVASKDEMAVNVLYAALYEPGIAQLNLANLPESHRQGPDYLNVLRFLDIPQALAMAVERTPVVLEPSKVAKWPFVSAVISKLKWPEDRVRIRAPNAE